ncbi:MAG: ABC transporter permease [Nevskiales bacterium]|nr:ABC transporter permease [Nevskiales bacterium]
MKPWITVYLKEVRENARDRRTLASALLYGPLIGPILFALMLSFMIGQQRERAAEPIELPVLGAEHAPNLVRYLRQQGVRVQDPPGDAEAAVREQRHDIVLKIPEDYPQRWRDGRPAAVELVFDASRAQTRTVVERTRALLMQFSQTVAALRLQARGITPDLSMPVAVVDRDVSTEQSRTGMLMSMMPYLLILSAFVGGMYLAIDTTSGERERQSLEPLLITPVARWQIMSGKLLATATYAAASLLICVAAFVVSFGMIPAERVGSALQLPLSSALLIGVVVLPIALLAAATQTVVAAMAKSFREAQTYLQFLIILPAVPSLILVVHPMKPELWMYWLPLFGQSALITDLVRGHAIAAGALLGCSLSTVLTAALFALLAIRLYRSERLAISG